MAEISVQSLIDTIQKQSALIAQLEDSLHKSRENNARVWKDVESWRGQYERLVEETKRDKEIESDRKQFLKELRAAGIVPADTRVEKRWVILKEGE